jgi:hypothetical protein
MTCSKAHITIQAALDGAIGELEREELDTHLRSCASCSAAMDDFLDLRRHSAEWALAYMRHADPGDILNRNVLEAIGSRPPGMHIQVRHAWTIGIAAVVFAVVLAIGAGFYIHLPNTSITILASPLNLSAVQTDWVSQINWLTILFVHPDLSPIDKLTTSALFVPFAILLLANIVLYATLNGKQKGNA